MPADGLPGDSGYSLAMAPDGHLWVGTTEALARFDGRRFERYDSRSDPSLPTNEIWWVGVNDDGSLTVALASGPLLKGRPGEFVPWPLQGTDPVRLAHPMTDGRTWLCRTNGIELHDPQGGVLWRQQFPGLARCAVTDGGYLVAYNGLEAIRLQLDSPESSERLAIPMANGTADVGIHTENGTTWIWNAGTLVEWPDRAGARFHSTPDALRGCVNFLRANGILWCAANRAQGLSRSPGSVLEMKTLEGSPDAALDLAFDRHGGLWVMTWGNGLWRLSAPPIRTIGAPEGLEPARIAFIHERPDGGVLLGGRGRIWHWQEAQLEALALPDTRGVNESWLSLATTPSGQLLLGRHHGLSLSDWPPMPDSWRDLYAGEDHGIYALHASPDGTLWIGSEFVARWHYEGPPEHVQDDLPLVYAFVQGVEGEVWAATQDGIWRQSPGGKFVRSDAQGPQGRRFIVMSATRDHTGSLWFGGYESGLWRHDQRGWQRYTSANGLPSDTAYGLVDDGHGRLWASHGRGLYTLDLGAEDQPLRARIREYGLGDGLRGQAFNGGSGTPALRARDGTLWFASDDGAVQLDPAQLPQVPAAPPIRIRAIQVDDTRPLLASATVQLPAGTDRTRIEIESPAPGLADRIELVWRLLPLSPQWLTVPADGAVVLTRLPPGQQRLELANRVEGRLHPGATLAIVQHAPWYLLPWTWAAALIAIVGVAGATFRWRLRALRERARRLEAEVAERSAALLAEQRRVLDAEAAQREAEQALRYRQIADAREAWTALEGDARLLLAAMVQRPGASLSGLAADLSDLPTVTRADVRRRLDQALDKLLREGLVTADGDSWRVARAELALLPDVHQPLAELALAQSRRIGAFRLVERIGSGGNGEVFRALNVHDGSTAAVKLLYADAELRRDAQKRLEREGDIVSKIRHPNIVRMLERGEHDGRLYLAMEYVPGRPLAQAIADDGHFQPARVRRIALALADALATLHAAGVVHRDVNPNNIRLTPDDLPVLLDFGLARGTRHSTLTRPQTLLGTLPYMAPEQFRGEEAAASADAWALGVVCVEMLTGHLPWRGATTIEMAVEVGAFRGWADYPPIMPPAWNLLVRALLDPDATRRPGLRTWAASVGEVAD